MATSLVTDIRPACSTIYRSITEQNSSESIGITTNYYESVKVTIWSLLLATVGSGSISVITHSGYEMKHTNLIRLPDSLSSA